MNADNMLNNLEFSDIILAEHFDSLPKKCRKSAKSLIEASVRVAYILFSTGDYQRARSIVDSLSDLPFSNSYDHWTWVEAALVLQGHIAKEAGEDAVYEQALDAVGLALQAGTELQVNVKNNVHRRFLEGQMLDAGFTDHPNEHFAFEMRVNYLMALLKMRLFGGSDTWPAGRLDAAIQPVVPEISIAVTKVGLRNLPPFK